MPQADVPGSDGRDSQTGPAAEAGRQADSPQTTPGNGRPTVALEDYGRDRQRMLDQTIERLVSDSETFRQAAHGLIARFTGADNADLVAAASRQHGAAVVQETIATIGDLVDYYRVRGRDNAGVLTTFRSGEGVEMLRERLETPLSDEQIKALTDMLLLPRRQLSRRELAHAVGQVAADPDADEQAVAERLSMPVGFGGQTGSVRGVLAGAREMGLTAEEMGRLAQMIQDGLREAVLTELTARNQPETAVRAFISDLSALPEAMVVPQSVRVAPVVVETKRRDGE